jgi:hypothetical protein
MITKAPFYLRIASLPFIGGFLYYYFTKGPEIVVQASLAGAFVLILIARTLDFINRRKARRQSDHLTTTDPR